MLGRTKTHGGTAAKSRTRLAPAERLKLAQLLHKSKMTISEACAQVDIGVSTANKVRATAQGRGHCVVSH